MKVYLYLIIILFTQLYYSSAALCRQTNDHKNYTCSGFKFRELVASPNTRKQILLADITDCKETSIQENEKGLIFPNLQKLKISCDVLTDIHENAFVKLNQLVELNLSSNSLSVLRNDVWKPLNDLKVLDLSFNKFKVLTNEMFGNGPGNLKKIYLSHNSISVLMPKAFKPFLQLEELFLNNNAIGPLTTGIFNRIPNILLIDLSHNTIKYLNDAFSNTRNLKYLNISHNSISELPSKVFQNTQLEIIDLSDNEIEAIHEDAFKWTVLQELYLQNNKISLFEVTVEAISTTPLKHLDLRNNRLVFLEDSFLKKATALIVLKVDANPWDCACYNKMMAVRGTLGLQVSNEVHQGMASMCVMGETNDCVIDRSTLQSYYRIFLKDMDD